MPRRKPTSTTQKKTLQKHKRAVKRGDSPPPLPPSLSRSHRPYAAPVSDATATARRLESSFLRPSPSYLSLTAHLASSLPLPRPLPPSASSFPSELLDPPGEALTCPRRPKWRYEMSKKEVEANEEGVFARWRGETDGKIEVWREAERAREGGVPSPTFYEQNLDVWRQLWRVTELSQIILLLLDARAPPTHFPPSIRAYLASLRPRRPIVLVLTKTDVVGPDRARAWEEWLRREYGAGEEGASVRVVSVEAYASEGARRPGIPNERRHELVRALREAHEELLRPPARVRGDPEKMRVWRPRVREEVGWGEVERGEVELRVGVVGEDERGEEGDGGDGEEEGGTKEPAYLTIGLIGQPNVGKSSLLNALFSRPRVRASRTPGKTKHLQTLFLTPSLRLVDCPGLVFPSYTPAPHQALCAVLPIARLPIMLACVGWAGRWVPVEEVLGLERARGEGEREREERERKRTWRGEREGGREEERREERWTAMEVLEAYALKKGWVTAKAGRPDVNRAGNAIMRALAEGRLKWGFLPPGQVAPPDTEGKGIWLGGEHEEGESTAGEETVAEEEGEEGVDESGEEEEGSEDGAGMRVSGGQFAALVNEEGKADGYEEEDDERDDDGPDAVESQ